MRVNQQTCHVRRHHHQVWRFNQLQWGSAVFVELGQCLETLKTVVLWECCHLWIWYTAIMLRSRCQTSKRLSFLKKRYRPLGKGKTSFLTLVHSIFREFVILAFPCVTLFTLCVCLSMQSRSSLCSFSYLYTPFIKSLRSLHGFAFRIGLVVVRWWIHFLKNENISIYWLHTFNIICLWKNHLIHLKT